MNTSTLTDPSEQPEETAVAVTDPCSRTRVTTASSAPRRAGGSTVLLAVLALALQACGGAEPVELDVSPAGTDTAVVEPSSEPDVPEADAPEPEPAPSPAPAPTPSVTPSQEPAEDPAPAPAPEPAEPDLEVDEDGCVTDRETGIVVLCHDDAAGKDPEPVS